MKYTILIISLLFSFAYANGQPCEEWYEDKLEPSSELIDCGGNFTIERLKRDSFIYKRYYPETKQITHISTYTSAKLRKLNGPYEDRWDDGTLVNAGFYSKNKKTGHWVEDTEVGSYMKGKRHGEWKCYTKDSLLIQIHNYENGILQGEQINFDTLGNIIIKVEYNKGNLIRTITDSREVYDYELPRFPGCEDLNLPPDELASCAEREFLQYIYGNLKYPEKARELNIEGKAYVQFTIDTDGYITDIEVLNGVSKDIENEVLSLINKSPKWRPGTQNGIPVNVRFNLPVVFRID